jgi:outer membrane protein with beta-barrel domain
MRTAKWTIKLLVGGLLWIAAMIPGSQANAQGRETRNVLGQLFKIPRWNVDLHAGIGNYGRFLLDTPFDDFIDDFRERELRGTGAFTLGLGVGATPLPRVGFRLGASHTWSNLEFRDDTGIGTDVLDDDDVGNLRQWLISAEVIRYLLLESSKFTPYGSGGILASWWHLDEEDLELTAPSGNTHFRWGATGMIGLQFRLSKQWRARVEAATASIGNPFTGNESFLVIDDHKIDEPSRVRKTDFRVALQYSWGIPHAVETTNGGNGRGRR